MRCDAEGCSNRLPVRPGYVTLGTAIATPLPSTGWVTTDPEGSDRRDFCVEHAALAEK